MKEQLFRVMITLIVSIILIMIFKSIGYKKITAAQEEQKSLILQGTSYTETSLQDSYDDEKLGENLMSIGTVAVSLACLVVNVIILILNKKSLDTKIIVVSTIIFVTFSLIILIANKSIDNTILGTGTFSSAVQSVNQ